MQFNSKGKLAKFYMWFPPDNGRLPQDLCTYFWGLIYRVIVTLVLLAMVATSLFGVGYVLVKFGMFLWGHKALTLTALGLILLVALSVWFDGRKRKIKSEALSEAKAIIKGKVDAVKNRYCPRIEWR